MWKNSNIVYVEKLANSFPKNKNLKLTCKLTKQ